MKKNRSGTMPVEAGVAMADNIVRLGDENAALIRLVSDLQRSLCECLIYSNWTAEYAKRAQTVALEAVEVLRKHGQAAVEVPGILAKGQV